MTKKIVVMKFYLLYSLKYKNQHLHSACQLDQRETNLYILVAYSNVRLSLSQKRCGTSVAAFAVLFSFTALSV